MEKVIQTGMEGVEPCLCVFYNYSLFYFMCNRGKHIIKTSTHQSASFGLAALIVSESVFSFLFFSQDKTLPESEEWKENCSLLMETPVHQALSVMRRMRSIV